MFRFLLILFVGLCSADRVYFEPCDGTIGNVLTVLINPCNGKIINGKLICILPHETTVKVSAAFSAPFTTSQLETVASAELNGQTIPFPESGQNPCKENIFPGCPLQAGELYMFRNTFKIWKFYPVGLLSVTFGISDRHGKSVACAKMQIAISRNPLIPYRE